VNNANVTNPKNRNNPAAIRAAANRRFKTAVDNSAIRHNIADPLASRSPAPSARTKRARAEWINRGGARAFDALILSIRHDREEASAR